MSIKLDISNFIFSEDSDNFSCCNRESYYAENVKYQLVKYRPCLKIPGIKIQAFMKDQLTY